MNKFTSFAIILIILTFTNQMFSQSRADFKRVESVSASATLPTISADHNAATAPNAEQRKAADMKLQLVKAQAELDLMIKYNNQNPSEARALQITELTEIVAKLQKALGIN